MARKGRAYCGALSMTVGARALRRKTVDSTEAARDVAQDRPFRGIRFRA